MFRHQGPGRSDAQNRGVAGYLAFFGGYVNSVGFLLIGSFTSHVTGNVGRLANDIVARQTEAAVLAAGMIAAFCAGAFVASMSIESNFFGRTANAYGFALLLEAALLLAFTVLAGETVSVHPRLHDLEAAVLCAAMGMQNSLVTRLSGAVVRTTHLTGVITDIGIEAARWFRWWRSTLSERLRVKLAFGRNPAEKPSPVKLALLATIAFAFTIGAVAGAACALSFHHAAMSFPCLGVAACGAYAFSNGRRSEEHQDAKSTRG
jgi:uncharacterized membrane protein YoaK (UPF0700 family)